MKKSILAALIMAVTISVPTHVNVFGQEQITDELNNTQIFYLENQEYGGRYKVIKLIAIGLSITNRTAEIYAEGATYDNAKISVKAELQQYKGSTWKTIATYKESVEDDTECILVKNRAMTSGYDYRVVAEITVDNGVQTETVTKTSNTEYCD